MKPMVDQCAFLQTMAERAFAGLDDTHLALEPAPGAKTAGWLVGHLAVTGDFARKLCGQRPLCPKEWRALFNPGSIPQTDRAVYPPMAELCGALRAVYTDLRAAALTVGEAQLAAENPYTPAHPDFPTVRSFVEYMLTGHFAYHIGQLVAWRAAAGLGALPPTGV